MKEYTYKINGNTYKVAIGEIDDNIAHVEVNGTSYNVEMEKKAKDPVTKVPVRRPYAAPAPAAAAKPAASSAAAIKSPLPGVILDIKAKEGDVVKKGDTLLILEAMKMENSIQADKDGKVSKIHVGKGDSVLEGNDLVTIE